jgi:hypothetical protein
VFEFSSVVVALLAPPTIALMQADPGQPSATLPVAPVPRLVDPYPDLPPLSDLARLPSADIAADWCRLQRKFVEEANAKSWDESLTPQLRAKYDRLGTEVMKNSWWASAILGAHQESLSEYDRRNFLSHLRRMEGYYTGRWPPPVPVGLMPENNP